MPESTNWCTCKHPVYKGVQMRSCGKWVSRIHEPGKNLGEVWLGSFTTAEMAARAHNAAALAIKGNFAILNFPELAPFLPRATSSSCDDVKAASMTSFSASADAATLSPLDALSLAISAPRTLSSCSSSLLPSSCTDNVSALEELGEILGKIVELPRLGAICKCEPMMSDVMNNLVYSDLDTWADPSGDQVNITESGIGSSF